MRETNSTELYILSPLEIQVYCMTIPEMKKKALDDTLRSQLKAVYPGDLAKAHIDILSYRGIKREKNDTLQSDANSIVFVAAQQVYQNIRIKNRTIVSGISAMMEAYNHYGMKNAADCLVIFSNPVWNEALYLRNSQIQRYIAENRGDPSLWIKNIKSLYEDSQAPSLIIIAKDLPKDDPEFMELCQIFPELHHLDWNELLQSFKPKKHELFKQQEAPIKAHSLIFFFLIAQNLSIFCALRVLEKKTTDYFQHLKNRYADYQAKAEESRYLLGEIGKLTAIRSDYRGNRITPYMAIAEVCRLAPDAWIRGLTVQNDRIDLELEGVDSCTTIDMLTSSQIFDNITLHEASPSTLRGDRFTLSGSIAYE